MNCSCYKFALLLGLSLASVSATHGQMVPVESDFINQKPTAFPKFQKMITDCLHVIGTVDDETECQAVQSTNAAGDESALDDLVADSSGDALYGGTDSVNDVNDQYYAQPDTDAQLDGYRTDDVADAPTTQADAYDDTDGQQGVTAPRNSIEEERFTYDAYIADDVAGSENSDENGCATYDVKFREESAMQGNSVKEEVAVPGNSFEEEEGYPFEVKFREEVAGPASSADEEGYGYDAESAAEPDSEGIVTPSQQGEPWEPEVVEADEPSEYQADSESAPLDVRYDRQVMLGVADFLGQLGVALQNVSRQLYSLAAEDMGSFNR